MHGHQISGSVSFMSAQNLMQFIGLPVIKSSGVRTTCEELHSSVQLGADTADDQSGGDHGSGLGVVVD